MLSALDDHSLDQIFRSAPDAERLFAVLGLVAAAPAQGR
jgi:hypothetical protein